MRLDGRWIGGGLLATLAGAAAALYFSERLSERPDARVLLTDGDRQLRSYPRMLLAASRHPGERVEATRAGFRALVRYIRAKDRDGVRIRMTVPVLTGRDGDGWRTRFVMPRAFTRDTLPPPSAADVRIEEEPAQRMIAIGFGGRVDDARIAEREAVLRAWAAEKGLRITGDASVAHYNSPLIPDAVRRTEILIPVG